MHDRSLDLEQLLGGMSPARFLADHWQKKPLLIRQALPGFRDLLSPDELAGLACEEGVRARLVTEAPGAKKPWRLETGPFPASRLEKLPRARWSLLVQDVNRYLESAALLLDRFRFLPGWRLDDLMVSFAPEGGGVGPHVDSYDVFLIQGMGRRRWEIAERYDPALIPGIDLKILRRFEAEESWVLEPGDMLYLPPGVAHSGVALEPCMTYSVGFRAPAARALAGSLFDLPAEALPPEGPLYEDPDLALPEHPAVVDAAAVRRARAVLSGVLADDAVLGRWLAAAVTSEGPPFKWFPESGREALRRAGPKRREALAAALAAHGALWRSDASRFAYREGEGTLHVFVDGEEYPLPAAARELVRLVLGARRVSTKAVKAALPKGKARDDALAWLAALKADGAIYLAERTQKSR